MEVQGLDVRNRVHVMPVGYERDRLVVPARRLDADLVVLLDPKDAELDYVGAVREGLDDAGIDHETVPCDIFDLYDSIGVVAELSTAHGDDEVYVNLASGSKVTAIGGMIACMATGATPYYVRAERYGEETDGVSEGVAEITRLPTYPIERPSREQVAMLDHLAEEGPASKQELIAVGERRGLPFLADYEADAMKGKYRLLDSRILDPLTEFGTVSVAPAGRRKMVSLTAEGRETRRAFAYLLE